MDGCMFKVVRKHCRTLNGWLYVQSCLKALQDRKRKVVGSKFFQSTARQ